MLQDAGSKVLLDILWNDGKMLPVTTFVTLVVPPLAVKKEEAPGILLDSANKLNENE